MKRCLLVLLVGTIACDAPPPATRVVADLVLDGSPGTLVDLRAAEEDLGVLLPVIASRPGSVLRVWGLPQDPADIRELAQVRSTAASRPAKRTVVAHERRFVQESTERLVPVISAYLSEARLTRSPIAESLARLLLAPVPPGTRRVVILDSDAAEESDLARFEAPRPLPTTEVFLARLDRAGILLSGSACGTTIVFAHCKPRPGSAALRRYDGIKSLWTAAANRAAAHLEFTTGPIPVEAVN